MFSSVWTLNWNENIIFTLFVVNFSSNLFVNTYAHKHNAELLRLKMLPVNLGHFLLFSQAVFILHNVSVDLKFGVSFNTCLKMF